MINKEVTLQNNISYTDITSASRLAANDTTLIANDGLHMPEKAYAVWANMRTTHINNIFAVNFRQDIVD